VCTHDCAASDGATHSLAASLLTERTENVHGAGMPMIGGPFQLTDGVARTATADTTLVILSVAGRQAAERRRMAWKVYAHVFRCVGYE